MSRGHVQELIPSLPPETGVQTFHTFVHAYTKKTQLSTYFFLYIQKKS